MKHLKYLFYILRHKWFVFIECCKLGIPWRGIMHDLSKFKPDEWFPYANYFYGKGDSNIFELAWLKHQRRNPHHWQYWILLKDGEIASIFSMPDKYKKEMLADWRGAGKAITGKDEVYIWYMDNKDKMQLHESTRWWVEDEILALERERV